MKTRFWMTALIAVVIALFNTSCVIHTGKATTVEEIYKMPPFKATVEIIDIDHSFIFGDDDVTIVIRKADGGYRLYLEAVSANKSVIGFAHFLHQGQSYDFPQVFDDYMNSLKTNTVTK
jgi:hypothetical protein